MAVTNEYLENEILTASPHRLHLLVVDGAIRFARQGLAAMEERQWEKAGNFLSRARDCVTELIGGINGEAAPQLAEDLKTVFLFAYRQLVVAELEQQPSHIRDAVRLLQVHRETWVELGLKLQSPGSSPSAGPALRIPEPHMSTSRSWVT